LPVAVGAIFANILKYRFHVAGDALHFFVHST
jgi:hypothetical protein